MCAARAREIYDRQAKERQRANGGDRKSGKSVPVNLPEAVHADARDQAGKAFDIFVHRDDTDQTDLSEEAAAEISAEIKRLRLSLTATSEQFMAAREAAIGAAGAVGAAGAEHG